MKKLVLITFAAFAFANCAKESVVDSDLNKIGNRIAFSPYSTITRGNPIDNNDEFMTSGKIFGVTAFSNKASFDTPYMGADNAGAPIISNGSWNYQFLGDARFWPTDGTTLNFFAYAPFADQNRLATLTFGKTVGMVFTNYVVSEEADKQQDFMYASVLNVAKETPAVAVDLSFKHAMTQILFKARVKTDKGLYVDIEENGISLHNINAKGKFTLPVIGNAVWADQSTPAVYVAPSVAVSELHGTEIGDVKDVFIANNVLMLLPQEFAAWDKNVDQSAIGQVGGYLSLKCKLYYKNGETIQYLVGGTNTFETINVPFSSKSGEDQIWKMNNKITYTLLIDGTWAGLEPITFTTNVESWDNIENDIN